MTTFKHTRPCLCCGQTFDSRSRFNRVCILCHQTHDRKGRVWRKTRAGGLNKVLGRHFYEEV